MTTQQAVYMRYQQMRQSAMRAFVVQAAGASKKEPVPPPPPVTTRHISLSAVEAGAPLGAVVSLQEYTQQGEPGAEVYANYHIETDISVGNTVRAAVPYVHQDGPTAHVIDRFVVNGVDKEPQTGRFNIVYVDVTPDTDTTNIIAEYRQ